MKFYKKLAAKKHELENAQGSNRYSQKRNHLDALRDDPWTFSNLVQTVTTDRKVKIDSTTKRWSRWSSCEYVSTQARYWRITACKFYHDLENLYTQNRSTTRNDSLFDLETLFEHAWSISRSMLVFATVYFMVDAEHMQLYIRLSRILYSSDINMPMKPSRDFFFFLFSWLWIEFEVGLRLCFALG